MDDRERRPEKHMKGPNRRRRRRSANTAWQNRALHWPDTQSRNAFKQSKERKRKKGGRGEGEREGERKRGGMKAGGICASL